MLKKDENSAIQGQKVLEVDFKTSNIHYLRMWKMQLGILQKFDLRKPWSMIITALVFLIFSGLALTFVEFSDQSSLQRLFVLLMVLGILTMFYNFYLLILLLIRKNRLRRDIANLCIHLEGELKFNYTFNIGGIEEKSSLRNDSFRWTDFKMIRINKHYLYLKFRKTHVKTLDLTDKNIDMLVPIRYIKAKDLLYELLYKEAMSKGVKVHFDYY